MIFLFQYGEIPELDALQAVVSRFPDRLRQDFSGILKPGILYQHVCAWLLLEKAVRTEYGIDSLDLLEIDRTGRGKPYSRKYPQIRFNLSHCDSACAAAVSMKEVGVDVERKFLYRHTLAKRVCHEEEWKYLSSLPDGSCEQTEVLRMLWSAKESLVKLDGSGVAYGMEHLNLTPLLRRWEQEGWQKGQPVRQELEFHDLGSLELMVQCKQTYTLAVSAREPGQEIVCIKKLTENNTSV